MSHLYDLQAVNVTYPTGTHALKDLCLQFQPQRRVAIMGANGSGKSTLMRLLNGLQRPSQGQILLEDEVIGYDRRSLLALRRRVQYCFQQADLQIFSTQVRDELIFGPLNCGLSSEEAGARAEKVATALGICGLLDKATHYLSGGEKKLVCFAAILTMDPEILLLDEPLANLDPLYRERVLELIEGLERTKSVFLVTHDASEAWYWADELCLLNDGRVMAQGPARELLQDEALLAAAHLSMPLEARVALRLPESLDWSRQDFQDRLLSHLVQV